MSNTKKISILVVLFIVAIIVSLLTYTYFSSQKNILNSNSPVAVIPKSLEVGASNTQDFALGTTTKESEASVLESKNIAEFSPLNDAYKGEQKKLFLDAVPIVNDFNKASSLDAVHELRKKYPDEKYLNLVDVIYSLGTGNASSSVMVADLDAAEKSLQNKTDTFSKINKLPFVYKSTIDILRARISGQNGDMKSQISHLMDSLTTRLAERKGNAPLSRFFILNQEGDRLSSDLDSAYFDVLVKSSPNDYRVYLLRGVYYGGSIKSSDTSKKYFPLALNDLTKALKLNPNSPDVHYFMGSLYTAKQDGDTKKNINTSITYLHKAVSINSSYTSAYLLLGIDYLMLADNKMALKNFGKVTELDPNNAFAYYFKGDIEDFLHTFIPYDGKTVTEKDKAEELVAIGDITKAIEIQENSPAYPFYRFPLVNLYIRRASCYFKMEDGLRSAKEYDKVIASLFAKQMINMDIKTIRLIYPEFTDISDDVMIEGFRQKYYPFSYSKQEFYSLITSNTEDKRVVKNKEASTDYMDQYSLSYYYMQRAEAYYNSNDFYKAADDYKRMMHNSSDFPVSPERMRRMN